MTDRSSGKSGLRVVVLSGPSGSGKSTIVDRLVNESPVKMTKAISATTRPPRVQEADGRDYYFLTPEEFETRLQQEEFVEYAEVHSSGHWYGTLKSELRRAHDAGGWALLEIDVNGALRVMEQFPDAVTIFLKTPSEAEYEKRLRERGTETEEVIRRRLQTARDELMMADQYCYHVVNDDLDRSVREISEILSAKEAELHA